MAKKTNTEDVFDTQALAVSNALMTDALNLARHLRATAAHHIDDVTARTLRAQIHRAMADCHVALSRCETILAARHKQATSLVGGKRSRAR